MGFLGGFLLGRETADNSKSSGGGLISNLLFIGLLIAIYNWIEDTSIQYFGDKLIELFITFILISILLFRYKTEKRSLSINFICLLLELCNLFLCVILGFTFFNKIGYTPFSFLIEWLNILNWGTHNSFLEIMGEIFWLILFPLHIIFKPLGFMIVQKYTIKLIKTNI